MKTTKKVMVALLAIAMIPAFSFGQVRSKIEKQGPSEKPKNRIETGGVRSTEKATTEAGKVTVKGNEHLVGMGSAGQMSKSLVEKYGALKVSETLVKMNKKPGSEVLAREFNDAIPVKNGRKAGSALLTRLQFALVRIGVATDGKFAAGNGRDLFTAYSRLINDFKDAELLETKTQFVERYEDLATRIETAVNENKDVNEAVREDLVSFLEMRARADGEGKLSREELNKRLRDMLECLGLRLLV
jgi:hypothetical protein